MRMGEKSIKELEEELKWYEETPFYIGRDGAPSIVLMTFGLISAIIWRYYKKFSLRKKYKQLKEAKNAIIP